MGPEIDFPVTVSGEEAVGSLSERVEGDVDLDPALTDRTFVRDLRGVAEGKELGTLEIQIPTGTPTVVQVDLSEADTVGDVRDAIESAVRAADAGAFGAAPWGAGVTLAGDRLQFNVAAGVTLDFSDGPIGQTAQALGLDGPTFDNVTASNPDPGAGLDPRVTDRTLLGDMTPATALVFGDITIENGGRSGTVTTAAGMSVGELAEAVRRLDLGVRLEVSGDGDSLSIVNEVSGMRMSVSDAGTATATTLGIRTLTGRTDLSVFNDGRGVEIADGEIDPITGLPDAGRNVDFEVTLSDGATSFQVDLVPADLADLDALLAKINAESGGEGGFTAALAADRNSIVFADTLGGAQAIEVSSLNGYAAEDLGLLDGTVGAGGELISEERSDVRVDSLFSSLIELRDALEGDDERGISFAADRLDADLERLTEARAIVGSRASRVDEQETRLQEIRLADERVRTELRDVDFAEAATRLNLLTTQLQAGYQVTSQSQRLSLINFLS
jgi:flagellin-like hook-associated protein FlgL